MSNAQNDPAVLGPVQRQVRQHTPGPWRLSAPGDICYVGGPDGQYILKRDSKKTWDKAAAARIVADCTLIAAAPELLMALQMLYDETADYIRLNNLGGMDNQCMQLARAALARAICAA